MHSRRSFLMSSAATAAMSRSAVGANDRIRFAIIGAGTRGSYVGGVFTDFPDVELAAVCDVFKPTREQVASKLGEKYSTKPEAVNDYRRVLDRKDVDALLVTTPDHWHGPIVIEASQAGKDCYCEKPLSNTIEMGQKMRAAVRQYKRVVQVGLQQRSWTHFQENAKRVQDGLIGKVYHVECIYQGNYTRAEGEPTAPAAGSGLGVVPGQCPAQALHAHAAALLARLLRLLGRHAARLGYAPHRRGPLVHELAGSPSHAAPPASTCARPNSPSNCRTPWA